MVSQASQVATGNKIGILKISKILQAWNFIKTRLQQLYSGEYCEIFRHTYFEEHLRTPASKAVIDGKKHKAGM